MGCGLYVYNSSTLQYEGSWGDKDKEEIFNLLHIEQTRSVIALTGSDLFSFDAEMEKARFFDSLEVINSLKADLKGLTANVGVVVHPDHSLVKCEIWVCSQTERRIFILNAHTLDILEEADYSERSFSFNNGKHQLLESMHSVPRKVEPAMSPMVTVIKEMQEVQVDYHSKVAVADNWMLLLWDAGSRKLEKTFNCAEYCRDSVSGKRNNPITQPFPLVCLMDITGLIMDPQDTSPYGSQC